MKTNRLRPGLLLLLLTALAGCFGQKSTDPAPADPAATGSEVRWKINGTQYAASGVAQVQGHYRPTTLSGAPAGQKDLLIVADDEKNYQVTVLLANFSGPGTYALTPTGSSIGGFTEMTGTKNTFSTQWSASGAAGQVVVTDFNADKLTVQGTFSFNARVRNPGGTFGPSQDLTSGTFALQSMWRY